MSNHGLIGRLENPITEDLHGYAAVLLGETMGLAADVIREQQAEIERLRKWIYHKADHVPSCDVYEGRHCSCGWLSAALEAK